MRAFYAEARVNEGLHGEVQNESTGDFRRSWLTKTADSSWPKAGSPLPYRPILAGAATDTLAHGLLWWAAIGSIRRLVIGSLRISTACRQPRLPPHHGPSFECRMYFESDRDAATAYDMVPRSAVKWFEALKIDVASSTCDVESVVAALQLKSGPENADCIYATASLRRRKVHSNIARVVISVAASECRRVDSSYPWPCVPDERSFSGHAAAELHAAMLRVLSAICGEVSPTFVQLVQECSIHDHERWPFPDMNVPSVQLHRRICETLGLHGKPHGETVLVPFENVRKWHAAHVASCS